MPKRSIGSIAAIGIAIALAAGGGYWLGQTERTPSLPAAEHAGHGTTAIAAKHQEQAAPPAARSVIYYKDPSGQPDFSAEPKKDAQGRDYLPVYADEEVQAAPPPPAPAPAPVSSPPGKGRILYYRNPMGLPDTSPVPKKDPMGMDYVPVYEGEDDGGSTVKISPDKIQKLGVRTEAAAVRRLTHTVRAVGTVQVDERRQRLVSPKFEGYVETLTVNATGQSVRQGEPLMQVYSPDLVLAQEEYLTARRSAQSLGPDVSPEARESARLLADGALRRLRNWDIPAGGLSRLVQGGTVSRTLALVAPISGVVMEKAVLEGQRFMPGEMLYRIADLSGVWLVADVFERELALVKLGQEAKVTFDALPGLTFTGKVTFIYPTLAAETRTAKVRIELPNHEGHLKPALYGTVTIAADAAERDGLAVPESALLDTGTRKVVLVDKGEGRFEPREVETGGRADGYVAILDGVSAGERVVVGANFLIDAESNLRAALQSLHHH